MKLKAGIIVHEDWQNNVTKDVFQEFQVTRHVPDIATQVPNLLTLTSSGTCHQDVADILEIKGTTKDHLEEMAMHPNNNMVLNEELEFIMNVVPDQNPDYVLYKAL